MPEHRTTAANAESLFRCGRQLSVSAHREQALRELTADELDLLRVLGSKHWVTNADPTQAEVPLGEDGKPRRGAEGIVNYLAAYVAGTAIGNGRLLDDNGRYVTYSYKDYRTDQIETRTCSGGEFVERLSLHIMPSGMQRVRYRGLFAAPGREQTLKHCRELIAASGTDPQSQSNEASSPNAHSTYDALLEEAGRYQAIPSARRAIHELLLGQSYKASLVHRFSNS